MEITKNKSIAIVGGGPGGLTLARLLQIKGADVKVYERDTSRCVRVQGATLDLHSDSGLKALDAAGLINAFKASYRPDADKMLINDKDANILYEDNFATDENDEFSRPEIDRGPLRDILLNSLQPETIVWDSQLVSLDLRNNTFKLEFKNGSNAFADIVIGADGANSKIRPYITSILPFYSGVTAIEGVVYDADKAAPHIYKQLNGGKIFVLSDEKTLIMSAKGDGSIAFYIGFKCDEFWAKQSGLNFTDKTAIFNWFKKDFSDWSTTWDELFENANYYIPRPQYCMPFNQTWQAQPNITILGDAAHLMPPYAGEGVNMAMLDALELAQCLTSENFADTHQAIAFYERQMRSRASETARLTMEQTDSLHSANAIPNLLALFTPEA